MTYSQSGKPTWHREEVQRLVVLSKGVDDNVEHLLRMTVAYQKCSLRAIALNACDSSDFFAIFG